MYDDTLHIYYDPPSTGKSYLIPAGLLFIPGIVLPIVGGIILDKNRYSDDDTTINVSAGVNRIGGWVFLGVGIACDGVGFTLLSIGILKRNNYLKYELLKDKYKHIRRNSIEGISINLNIDF